MSGPAEHAGQASVELDGSEHAGVLDGIQVALGSVADLESAPVADHAARLQAVHRVLQDALADGRPSA